VFAAGVLVASQAGNWPAGLSFLSWPATSALIRTALAVLLATSALILVRPLAVAGTSRTWLPLVAWLPFALLAPAAYAQSRCDYFEEKLAECLEQHRLGHALALAQRLREYAPAAQVAGVPVSALAAELDRQVRQIEDEIAEPLPPESPPAARLERAKQHAILGDVAAAQAVLEPLVRADPPHPLACLRLGTAYESEENWRASREWYEKARNGLAQLGPAPQIQPPLLQATKGVAYTERKLGRYREAEAAYREALALSPSAEMHFLLAQFYEDGQQSAKAREHALAAARLDAARYAAPSQKMLGNLATGHFGCLTTFFGREAGAK
jgi:tetratricopeptide (TPR) repeat protein